MLKWLQNLNDQRISRFSVCFIRFSWQCLCWLHNTGTTQRIQHSAHRHTITRRVQGKSSVRPITSSTPANSVMRRYGSYANESTYYPRKQFSFQFILISAQVCASEVVAWCLSVICLFNLSYISLNDWESCAWNLERK